MGVSAQNPHYDVAAGWGGDGVILDHTATMYSMGSGYMEEMLDIYYSHDLFNLDISHNHFTFNYQKCIAYYQIFVIKC